MDFEYLGRDLAEPYAAFIQLLRDTLAPYGLPLITALAPKTSAAQPGTLYEGHNYASLSTASDAVLLMTYEWGYTYGPPMAVAPVGAVPAGGGVCADADGRRQDPAGLSELRL